MTDTATDTKDNKKKLSVTASDLNRVIPKLATKVLLGKVGSNTTLTFVVDIGENKAQVIETIALDATLHEGLLKLLQKDAKGDKNE